VHPEILSEAIEPFIDDRLIDSLLYPVKSGKEGVLYCATAGPRVAADLVAVKVYKPQKYRAFRDDSMYRSGRAILNERSARAAAKQTRFGREVRASLWTDSEYQTLRILHRAGAHVPKPLGHTSGAVVMEWIGDAEGPAPQLKEVKLDRSEAADLFQALIANIELWLACNIVHADLSSYNLLYQAGRLIAIDFPQAVDPRSNLHAPSLLARDLGNVCQFFSRFGVESDPNALADDMWDRFIRGCL
jgi:RIO kinase 1